MTDNVNRSVETQHPQYENRQYEWRQMRDSAGGTTNVKRSGTLYLPMPNAMLFAPKINTPDGILTDSGNTNTDVSTTKDLQNRAPWSHSNPAYSAYLQRARFPDIVSACARGLVGIATKQDPEIKLPSSISYLEDSCTPDGKTLVDLYEQIIDELLTTGRYELLVEPKEDGTVTFIEYTAESFINWKSAIIEGEQEATLAVFEEQVSSNQDDEFSHDTVTGQNVLRLTVDPEDETGLSTIYTKQFYKEGVVVDFVIPTVRGRTLDKIPLVVGNAQWLGLNVGSSPMLGISDLAISIYQKDADKSQSEYLTCNPMLVTSGVDSEDVPNIIGSAVSWNLPNSEAKAYYVEPESNCLQHINETIKNSFEEASFYGASLLGPSKKAAESAETTSLKQAAQGATLKQTANQAGQMILKALQIAAEWTGSVDTGVEFDPNLEFAETKLSPQEQTALLQSWMNRAISDETYFENLKKAGIQPVDRTFEEEKTLIENKAPDIDAMAV